MNGLNLRLSNKLSDHRINQHQWGYIHNNMKYRKIYKPIVNVFSILSTHSLFFFAFNLNTTLQSIFMYPTYLSSNFVAIVKIWKIILCVMMFYHHIRRRILVEEIISWHLLETNTSNQHYNHLNNIIFLFHELFLGLCVFILSAELSSNPKWIPNLHWNWQQQSI